VSSKNSTVSIHNPTLRFLAKWLAMVVHSRTDLRLCSLPELQCLYAMANKIRFSPIRSMLAHWQKMITAKGPIDITPLVTRVARYVKAMEGAEVTFFSEMEAYRYEVSLEHFVQGHIMWEGPGNSIFMCYPGYDREIELPCPRLSLYSVKSLTLQMEKREPARRSVADPQTRSRTRREQAEAGPSRRTPPVHASAQPGPSTENMSFEEAYRHYNYDPYQAGSSGFAGGQGPYYPASMHSSYGPQVGPSSSARFNYEDPILRSIADLSNRISTLGTQQQEMQDTMAHNTQLTQESWGLTSALQYDVSNIFIHLGMHYQQSQL